MHRTLIAVSLATAGIFGTGVLVGQLQGTTPAAAATKPVKTKVAPKTKHVKTNATTHQSTSGTAHADGKVTAVNGNIIKVQADADPAGSTEYTKVTTIVLSGSTTYKSTTTKSSIVVGAYVIAEGTVSSDGTTLTATSVGVGGPGGGHGGGPGGGHGGPHADGTVTAVKGNTISLNSDTDPAGSTEYTKVTTIVVSSSTTYDRGATLASIVVGANIDAEGTLSPDGTTLTATQIGVRGA